jgi:hypothetical protein
MPEEPIVLDTCTVTALTAKSGCYNCLSQSEKLAAMTYLMGSIAAEYNEDLELANPTESRKLFACLACEPDSVLDSFLLSVWMDIAVGSGAIEVAMTAAQVRAAIKCFCGIGPKEFKAAQVYLFCKLFSSRGEDQYPCWVAREAYGAADPRWRIFRAWLMVSAPGWFRSLYTAQGRWFAKWIADKPRVKRVIRYFMDRVVNRSR